MLNQRQDRFKRIAASRTNKILDMLRLLGNCSNTANYEYSTDEIRKIFTAIETEVRLQKAKFMSKQKAHKFSFDNDYNGDK